MEYGEGPMNKMNKKQLIGMVIWYLLYMAAMEFFRFKFGIFKISLAFLLIGLPLVYFLSRPKKTPLA